MPINIYYEKKDEHGNIYYTDTDGNRIVEELKFTPYEQYYVDNTPEQWAIDRAAEETSYARFKEEQQRAVSPFVLNKLQKPTVDLPRYPLWGEYWAEREFCILAGDTGVGKSLMAIQTGKHLAGGLVLGDDTTVGRPRNVLYIDFELDAEGFWSRYGDDEATENFYWAGFNAHATMPKTIETQTEWLLNNLEKHIEQTSAEVLIIDQLDRVQLPIGKRTDFLFKLKALTRKYKLSTMLVLNTRPRNFSRPVELQHIQNSQLYVPFADSVIAIAADYYYDMERYLKPLKMRNRIMSHSADVECFSIYQSGNENESEEHNESEKESENDVFRGGAKLSLYLTATRPEGELLRKSKTVLKQEQIMKAETMRKDGMSYEYIADAMQVPITTAKRWVSCVSPSPPDDLRIGAGPAPLPGGEGSVIHMIPRREQETTPSPSRLKRDGTPPLQGESLYLVYEKPDGLSEEEWAMCVNNPASVFFDEFAYNPYLVEREMRELGGSMLKTNK